MREKLGDVKGKHLETVNPDIQGKMGHEYKSLYCTTGL
jgi:hypothetical protein